MSLSVTPDAAASAATTCLHLLATSLQDPWGQMSASVYDTAIVSTLPNDLQPYGGLPFLLTTQAPDGTWGAPRPYQLVPTLAATLALLTWLHRATTTQQPAPQALAIARAAQRGLAALPALLEASQPDTVAIEFIVPSLVEQIAQGCAHLQVVDPLPPAYPAAFWDLIQWCRAIILPTVNASALERLRMGLYRTGTIPELVTHSLEVLGRDIPLVRLAPHLTGSYGCSPAATAAALHYARSPHPHAVAYLAMQAERLAGAQPNVAPMATFDRAWIASMLLHAGLRLPRRLRHDTIDLLQAHLGDRGVSFGWGGPPDGDDTSVVLTVLEQLGVRTDPLVFARYEADTYFRCFAGERTPSISTNAHILEYLSHHLRRLAHPHPPAVLRMADKCAQWLLATQAPDGCWTDKWHASPFYATMCCIRALSLARRPKTLLALLQAQQWLLATQASDGGWGVWGSTHEETAYALHTLCDLPRTMRDVRWVDAIRRGALALERPTERAPLHVWHGKELYTPMRVVAAVVQSARLTVAGHTPLLAQERMVYES